MAIPEIGSIDYVKYINVTRVFQIILKEARISRSRIAELSGISKVTVSSCVDYLLEKELIQEIGIVDTKRGRPPMLITLNAKAGIIVGIEADVIYSKIIVTDFSGKLLEQRPLTRNVSSPEEFVSQISKDIREIRQSYPEYCKGLMGVGIALSGYYNEESGKVEYVANRKDWIGFPLREAFRKQFPDTPLVINRQANAGALGEGAFDPEFPKRGSLAFLSCSWGLGVGLYQTVSGQPSLVNVSSRFGHTTINYNGRVCDCGNRGCLEAYVSLRALYRQMYPGESVCMERVEQMKQRFKDKDPSLQNGIRELVLYLSIGAANVINAYQPQKLIVGGLIQLFLTEEDLEQIRLFVKTNVPEIFRRDLQIDFPKLGVLSAGYGCVADVRNRILQYIF